MGKRVKWLNIQNSARKVSWAFSTVKFRYKGVCIHKGHHDDVIKWKHFPRYWPFVRGIHWSPVNSPDKGQWRGALMLSLICASINVWANNREAIHWRCHRAHYYVTVMYYVILTKFWHWLHRKYVWCSRCTKVMAMFPILWNALLIGKLSGTHRISYT